MTHMPDNHERIATNLNVQPLLAALESLPELWDQITVRQDYPGSAHHDTQAIFLRGPRVFTFEDYMLSTVAFDYPAMEDLKTVLLPLMRPILHELDVSELGFVIIARLKAGGHIDAHVDEGTYADHYSRFHIALNDLPGATLTVGGQAQHYAPGECWWFNHKVEHFADNASDQDRIHLIFDAVTPRYRVHVPD
jgi:hypothetical protein